MCLFWLKLAGVTASVPLAIPAPAPACAGALVLVDRDTRRVLMPKVRVGGILKSLLVALSVTVSFEE